MNSPNSTRNWNSVLRNNNANEKKWNCRNMEKFFFFTNCILCNIVHRILFQTFKLINFAFFFFYFSFCFFENLFSLCSLFSNWIVKGAFVRLHMKLLFRREEDCNRKRIKLTNFAIIETKATSLLYVITSILWIIIAISIEMNNHESSQWYYKSYRLIAVEFTDSNFKNNHMSLWVILKNFLFIVAIKLISIPAIRRYSI